MEGTSDIILTFEKGGRKVQYTLPWDSTWMQVLSVAIDGCGGLGYRISDEDQDSLFNLLGE